MMGQQQWQPQPQMHWQGPMQQQQQWQQAQMAAEAAPQQQQWQQGQEPWQQGQQPQPQQWPQQQPPQQPKPAGKGDWRELWHQQLQQQQQQQQWGQGMPVQQQQQQWGQAMAGGQPYGGNMYNQQQAGMYNYNYGQQQQQPAPPGMPPACSQQAWGGAGMYQQQQQQQAGYNAAAMQHMQQQGSALPSPQTLGSAMGGAGVGLQPSAMPQQQPEQAPTPAAPAAPPSPPKPLDLSQLLLPPGRHSRPKRLLLLLRGPPGCGKSHLARTIRSMEVSAGGQPPRVHSIDDYFMVDVEQTPDEGTAAAAAAGTGSSKRRGAAPAVTAQEYQYDADLEPSYWKSLLRAAVKTLGDGLHPLVLLDAATPKAEQVREVWSAVQGAGAELLVVNPLTTDPQVSTTAEGSGSPLDAEGW